MPDFRVFNPTNDDLIVSNVFGNVRSDPRATVGQNDQTGDIRVLNKDNPSAPLHFEIVNPTQFGPLNLNQNTGYPVALDLNHDEQFQWIDVNASRASFDFNKERQRRAVEPYHHPYKASTHNVTTYH